jgi:hypothetical protein
MKKIDIRDLFLDQQKEMIVNLEKIRKHTGNHAPTTGDASEGSWAEWLRNYLPNRYNVDRAIVVSSEGIESDAIDIVIYDQQYSPFVWIQEGVKKVPAESVYAVIECKQDISKGQIEYAAKKAKSVRELYRTVSPVVDRGESYTPPPLFNILGGIITLENTWADSIKNSQSFNSVLSNATGNEALDFGCVLSDRSFIVDKDGVHFSEPEESLIFFFTHLFNRLQKLGTVRPIDMMEYLKHLESI